MRLICLSFLLPIMSNAANYAARKMNVDGIEVIRLTDAARHTEVSIVPSVGNIAYEFRVNGGNLFWAPFQSPAELKSKPVLCGNPFLAPWANRLDGDAYFANGKAYKLNAGLGNLRRDSNQKPIHGLLVFSPYWEVTALEADGVSAHVTSRLEFWKHPDLMAQFPFAHTIEMTYRLRDGALEVETALRNHSMEPMPVAVGYHPYFRLYDAPRDEWSVRLAAREQFVLSNLLIPAGERKRMPYADPQSLSETALDDVFGSLIRQADGKAHFSVQGKKQKLSVLYGPKYTVAVVYAPKGKDFICFEPMSAVTDGLNLAHTGVYKELQSVPAGGEWRESYWIVPEAF